MSVFGFWVLGFGFWGFGFKGLGFKGLGVPGRTTDLTVLLHAVEGWVLQILVQTRTPGFGVGLKTPRRQAPNPEACSMISQNMIEHSKMQYDML